MSRLSRGHSGIELHINQAQMSQVSLGRPEFVPGTPPGHPDRQIPLCDFSLSVFFSPYSKLRRKFATNFAENFANFTLEVAGVYILSLFYRVFSGDLFNNLNNDNLVRLRINS